MSTRNRSLLFVSMLLLCLIFAPASHAALSAVGPRDPATCPPGGTAGACGFPAWYQDETGLSLAPCFDLNGFCSVTAAAFPNPALPFGPTNFPDEGFYFVASADVPLAGGTAVLYEAAVEFAFGGTGAVAPGNEITFVRTRFVNKTAPAGQYTIVHPYGTHTIDSAPPNGIKFTEDNGDIGVQFQGVLTAPNSGPFLRCANGSLGGRCVGGVVTSPDGNVYIGDSITPGPATGPAVTSVTISGADSGTTSNFALEGKIIGMSVTPTSITFAAQKAAVDSAPVAVTVTNLSTVNTVAIGQIVSQGTNAADFTIPAANDTCSNVTLAASGNCAFNVVLNGAAVGPAARTGTILIPSATPTAPPVFVAPISAIIDAVAPSVASRFPAGSSAPANANVTFTFDEAMDPATINATTLTVSASGLGALTATPVYSVANKTVSFALAAFETQIVNQVITAQTTTGMTDLVGNPLSSAVTFSFTATEPDRVAPSIGSISPANNATGVRTDSKIILTFSEAMLSTSITGSTIQVTSGANAVPGTVTVDGNVATFTPSSQLAFGTAYTVTVASGSLDLASNAVATGQTVNFITNFAPEAPEIVSPANGVTGVALPVVLRWKRSTDQDQDTVQYHLFYCNNQNFIGTAPNCVQNLTITPTTASASDIYYAGIGSWGALLSLLGLGFAFGFKGRRKIFMLIAVLVVSGLFLVSCGKKKKDNPAPVSTDITYSVPNLPAASVTYYWKVEADDGKGGVSATSVRTFTTQ